MKAPPAPLVSRRSFALAIAPLLCVRQDARAFENALPAVKAQIENKPASIAASKPGDIGIKNTQTGALRPCLDGKPHCFSSTSVVGNYEVDTSKIGKGWLTETWSYSGKSVAGAFADIRAAVAAYPPGQGGIDEGGYQVALARLPESADSVGYLYVQFESGGSGYIDDMEFSLINGVVNVRTSSRLGYADYGVNAKRYNWFANKLGAVKGWKTSPIRKKEHLDYFAQNDLESDKDVGL